MQQIRMTSTDILAQAMYLLSQQIQSPDGVAEIAILEAAERLVMQDSMCKAAAVEIEEHWDAHCGKDGDGPTSLLYRLQGKSQPAVYDAHVPDGCKHIVPVAKAKG